MPTWDLRAGLGCGIPKDRSARRICYLAENKWQPGSKDPHKAALDWAVRENNLQGSNPFGEVKGREDLQKVIISKEKEIESILDTQWKTAKLEYEEDQKKIQAYAEKYAKDQIRVQSERIAAAGIQEHGKFNEA